MFDLIPFDRNERKLFNRFFDDDFFGGFGSLKGFQTDIIDKGDHFMLEAELPGFKKEDIHVDLNGDYLTIHAERSDESKDENDRFVRRERHYGAFSRSFNVADINIDDITAEYKHGVLKLKLPKAVPAAPEAKKIEVR